MNHKIISKESKLLESFIGIDGEIGLYSRKQHLDSFGNS